MGRYLYGCCLDRAVVLPVPEAQAAASCGEAQG